MKHDHFTSYGGGTHHTAIIGHPPESRGWDPSQLSFEPIVASTARIEAFVTIDAGVYESTRVGERSWIFKGAHCGHDAQIGADCEIATHAVIGGHAVIEDGAKIGLGAIILPYRRVGKNAVVGAGAVVTRDVEDGDTVAGNPARSISPSSRTYTERTR